MEVYSKEKEFSFFKYWVLKRVFFYGGFHSNFYEVEILEENICEEYIYLWVKTIWVNMFSWG